MDIVHRFVRSHAHSVIARKNIVRILASKVEDGDLKLEDAKRIATWILKRNVEVLFFPEGL